MRQLRQVILLVALICATAALGQKVSSGGSSPGDVLYATALGWPSDGALTLHTLYAGNPYLSDPVCSIRLLGTSDEIPYRQQPDGIHLTLPATPPSALPADIAWVFAIRNHCSSTPHR